MNFTWLSSLFTVLSLLVFLGIWYWAFSSRNKDRFEALARLPLEPDDVPVAARSTHSHTGA